MRMRWPWWSRRSHPEPPRNVHVVLLDGTVVPVDCVYLRRHRGHHLWVATTTVPFTQVAQLGCDRLPAHTDVLLCFP